MAGATYLAEYADEVCQSWITYAWLTGRSRGKELILANLTKMERTLFDASMTKEWDNWKNFKAVTVVTGKEAKELLEKAKPIPSRWVHTNKNEFDPKLPMQAKSRLVAVGCYESVHVRTDSPTSSLLVFHLICSTAARKHWPLTKLDATSAYLQGDDVDRMLVLRPPSPLPPGVEQGSLFICHGAIYGTKDAGGKWWSKLRRTLRDNSWQESRLERAFFLLFENGKLVGLVGTYVDDLFATGNPDSELYRLTTIELKKVLLLTVEHPPFRYCGKYVEQAKDFSIEISMGHFVDAMEEIEMPKSRAKQSKALATDEEKSFAESVIGSLG